MVLRFFLSKQQRKPRVLTPEIKELIHIKLETGDELRSISEELGLKYDTLKKAKKAGRILLPLNTQNHSSLTTTKSQLNHTDDKQALGKACSNLNQRVLSAVSGVNSLPSGELGRTIGIDRIPEVKTLRDRIAQFSEKLEISTWGNKLSKDWMEDNPELSAVLYIDGHVKLYYGKDNSLPKRFVSRMRLALSGTTDYWVNDVLGQPFFVINKVISSGLIQIIKDELLEQFDRDIPNQPTEMELEKDSLLNRYMLVFDREGYSPDFFMTYGKQEYQYLHIRKTYLINGTILSLQNIKELYLLGHSKPLSWQSEVFCYKTREAKKRYG